MLSNWLFLGPLGFTCWISFAQVFCFFTIESFISFLYLDVYVLGVDALIN